MGTMGKMKGPNSAPPAPSEMSRTLHCYAQKKKMKIWEVAVLAGVIQFQERLVSTAPGTGGYSSVLALRRSPKRSDRTQMTQVSFSLFFLFFYLLLLMLLCIKQRVTNGQPGQMTVYDSALPTSLLPPCMRASAQPCIQGGEGGGGGWVGIKWQRFY